MVDAARAARPVASGRPCMGLPDARIHVLYPLLALLLGSWLLMGNGLDQAIAARLYALQGGAWTLKDHWVTEYLVHRLGHDLSIVAGLLVLALAIASEWIGTLSGWRRPLLRLFASVTLSAVVVSLLKKVTGMDCPWDLVDFGGSRAFHGLLDARPVGVVASGCFPAGHASAGYGWLALYFLALDVRPRLRHAALGMGAGLGLVFGLSQQLRGAHFMSHDLWTAAICWFVALGLYRLWPPRRTQRQRRP
ncbi:phosphatase PAP2 family protein [Stenotrophomonas tumulicola]|nr:phosphatase PAP2 family protein [Stenotrophomonas tumulicola]